MLSVPVACWALRRSCGSSSFLLQPPTPCARCCHGFNAGCAAGLAKTMLGVGLVALPRALLLLGALPASLAFLALATLCHLSCGALAAAGTAAARSGLPAARLSYSGVLALQLGPWAALVLDAATMLNCLGMMTAYLIASGDVLASDEWRAAGAPSWLAALLRSRPAVLALLSAAVLAPLLSFRCARCRKHNKGECLFCSRLLRPWFAALSQPSGGTHWRSSELAPMQEPEANDCGKRPGRGCRAPVVGCHGVPGGCAGLEGPGPFPAPVAGASPVAAAMATCAAARCCCAAGRPHRFHVSTF